MEQSPISPHCLPIVASPPTGAAYSVAIIGAAGLLGRLLTGVFLDRFFGPRVSQIMLLMTVLGIVLLSVANSLTAGLTAAGLIGFSMGSEGDITPYLLTRYFGLNRFSTLYALTWTAYAIGGATGPMVVGRVFDTLGLLPAHNHPVAGSSCAIALPAHVRAASLSSSDRRQVPIA